MLALNHTTLSIQVDFESKAVSRLVIIATEEKFLVWSTKSTRANNIEIPYTITTPANEETLAEAVYSLDYEAIKVLLSFGSIDLH